MTTTAKTTTAIKAKKEKKNTTVTILSLFNSLIFDGEVIKLEKNRAYLTKIQILLQIQQICTNHIDEDAS